MRGVAQETPMRNFIEEEGGTTAIEYALIASMMTMVLAGAVGTLQQGVGQLFRVVAALSGDAL